MVTTDFLKYVSLLYDKVRFPVQVIDQNGKVVYTNEAYTILWGYHLEELAEYSISVSYTHLTLPTNREV